MADELIDVVDESNKLTGVRIMKSKAHAQGILHRASHVWIYNSRGEILLQLRSKSKPVSPNVWDVSAAGHIGAGEDPVVCAVRETEEEIGLKAEPKELEFLSIYSIDSSWPGGIRNREFCYNYLLKFDGKIDDLKIQKSEVQEIKFISLDALEKDLKANRQRYGPNLHWEEIISQIRRRLND
jgi:isopentenyl-diphosphate Delta-isomerase